MRGTLSACITPETFNYNGCKCLIWLVFVTVIGCFVVYVFSLVAGSIILSLFFN